MTAKNNPCYFIPLRKNEEVCKDFFIFSCFITKEALTLQQKIKTISANEIKKTDKRHMEIEALALYSGL
ncbi:MAG: hypothetical protein IJT97_07515 [Bacteroidaceae bacterium]|nr:hypothetical protein [Bacteroidaceae bacterium]